MYPYTSPIISNLNMMFVTQYLKLTFKILGTSTFSHQENQSIKLWLKIEFVFEKQARLCTISLAQDMIIFSLNILRGQAQALCAKRLIKAIFDKKLGKCNGFSSFLVEVLVERHNLSLEAVKGTVVDSQCLVSFLNLSAKV